MASIRIRRALATDIKELVGLLQLLFSIEEDFEFDASRQRRGLTMMLAHDGAVILVAEEAGRVIGMCTGQRMISTAEGGYSLLIEDVVVAEGCQGRGVGRGLLQGLEVWAEEMKVLRFQLLADRSNAAGLGFYHKQNWQDTELICLCKRPLSANWKRG